MQDNLNKAFRLMRKQGLLARQNFSCCGNCGGYELTVIAEKLITSGKAKTSIRGCCFYHHQDNTSKKAGHSFYLRYGPMDSIKHGFIGLPTAEVGLLVCSCLTEAGVKFEWDGKASTCILVVATPKLSNYDQFKVDMKKAKLKVVHYNGRFSYEGPAVFISSIQKVVSATKVPCQWDNLGKDWVVYPK